MAKIRSQQLNPNLTGSFNLSGSFIVTGSLLGSNQADDSGSFSTRLTTEESNVDALQAASASFSTRVTGLKTDSGSFSTRISTVEGNVGAQDLNTYATFAGLNLTEDTSITGSLTVSGDVSGSSTSTGSFGHLITNTADISGGSISTTSGSFSRLDVTDNVSVGGAVKGGLTINQSGGARGLIIHAEDSSHSYMQISNTTTGTTTGDGLQFGMLSDESGFIAHQENNYLRFDTNATERFRITADGDITFSGANQEISASATSTGSFGEGNFTNVKASNSVIVGDTADNTAELHISGSGTQRFTIQNNTATAKHVLTSDEYSIGTTTDDMLTLSVNNSTVGRFYSSATNKTIELGSGVSTGNSQLWIDGDSGNVGIGTRVGGVGTPSAKLHVIGDIKATGDVIAENYIVSSSVVHLTQSFSSGSTIFGDSADDVH